MKYFTRDLCELSWRDEFPPQLWDAVLREYETHRRKVTRRLPKSSASLGTLNLHDATVTGVFFPAQGTVAITTEGSRHFLDSTRRVSGVHTLSFIGVTDVSISPSVVGVQWLYQEVDFRHGLLELRALLETDEILIRFERFNIRTTPNTRLGRLGAKRDKRTH